MCIGAAAVSLVGRCLYCHETSGERYIHRTRFFIPNLDHLIDPDEANLRQKVNRNLAA